LSTFTQYELRALQLLVTPRLGATVVDTIAREASLVSYDYTEVGYFLTVAHPSLPHERIVCDEPLLTGRVGDTEIGFIVFLESGELTFECYTFGLETVPDNIRELNVTIDQ
jgi:hypothetical protein